MCDKKYINLKTIKLNFKNMGLLYFVPYIFLFVIIPLKTISDKLNGSNMETVFGITFLYFQIFCPFFAIWWTLFGYRNYFEGSSKEIILAYKNDFISELVVVFIWYFLHICLLMALYVCIWGMSFFPYIFIFFSQAFIFFSVCILLAIIFRTISVSFVLAILYTILCMFSNTSQLKAINMLCINPPVRLNEQLFPYIFIFLSGLIVLAISYKIIGIRDKI